MRIIRVRKGFTTNSSSASEWLSSTPPSETNPNNSNNPNNITPPDPSNPKITSPFLVKHQNSNTDSSNHTQQFDQTSTNPEPVQQVAPKTMLVKNGFLLGGVLGFLISLFFLEKLVKKLWNKCKSNKCED